MSGLEGDDDDCGAGDTLPLLPPLLVLLTSFEKNLEYCLIRVVVVGVVVVLLLLLTSVSLSTFVVLVVVVVVVGVVLVVVVVGELLSLSMPASGETLLLASESDKCFSISCLLDSMDDEALLLLL